jgi:twinkle protein
VGKIVQKNLPCVDQIKCKSHDARQVYENGTSYCFSCRKWFDEAATENFEHGKTTIVHETTKSPSPFKKAIPSLEEIATYSTRGFRDRAITKVVNEFFGVKVSYDNAGNIDAHFYPYLANGKVGYKIRTLPKTFTWSGDSAAVFGIDRFPGGGKRVVIVEGEIDALSIAQAYHDKYQKIYPVIALSSATVSEKLIEHREWLRSFKEVVLFFDADTAGDAALASALKIVGIDKAKVAKPIAGCKDANEVLVKHGAAPLMQCVWDATAWSPAGIVGKEALWDALANYNSIPSLPYPPCLEGVNTKLKGMRSGEIVLLISGTGSGKSTILRETMLHILETTDEKIGIVSLEESPHETARKLAGMVINRNPANEEIPLEDLKVGFDTVFGEDRVVLLDHQGSIKDDSIIDQLEYMALVGCKKIFIDHITILVSEGTEGLTGNEAIDKVMNDLLRLVKRHEVWIGLVSHLRKAPSGGKSFEDGKLPSIDDIRGSGSIKQISFDIIAFARNLTAESDRDRNTIKMRILKSRYTGLTGNVPGAFYDHTTGRLRGVEGMPSDEFEPLG